MSSFSGAIVTKLDSAADAPYWKAEDYHQQYLQKDGQDATKGSLKPIQCYGARAARSRRWTRPRSGGSFV